MNSYIINNINNNNDDNNDLRMNIGLDLYNRAKKLYLYKNNNDNDNRIKSLTDSNYVFNIDEWLVLFKMNITFIVMQRKFINDDGSINIVHLVDDLNLNKKKNYSIYNNSLGLSNDTEKITTFSNSKNNPSKIIFKLLSDLDNYNNLRYRFLIIGNELNILINKKYLDNITTSICKRPYIFKYINSDWNIFNIDVKSTDIPITKNIEINDESINNNIKLKPFNYQINNVHWMKNLETIISMNLSKLKFVRKKYIKYRYVLKPLYTNDNYNYYASHEKLLYNENLLKKHFTKNININGGVLCDEVGLGKTFSMFCLIISNLPLEEYNNKCRKYIEYYSQEKLEKRKIIVKNKKKYKFIFKDENNIEHKWNDDSMAAYWTRNFIYQDKDKYIKEIENEKEKEKEEEENENENEKKKLIFTERVYSRATLICCPKRLCAHWEDEINKYKDDNMELKIIKITTIIQYRKLFLGDLCAADIIIICIDFINNINYQKESDLLENINWYRIIVDEGHEIMTISYLEKSSYSNRNWISRLLSIYSKYKWVCSGTPLARNNDNFGGILYFLTNGKFKYEYLKNLEFEIKMDIINRYFHRNIKENLKSDIFIPNIIENTIFLKQSPTERTVYLSSVSYGDTLRMMQLCTHILVSEYELKVLGDNVETLENVHLKMTEHYNKCLIDEYLKLDNTKFKIDEVNETIQFSKRTIINIDERNRIVANYKSNRKTLTNRLVDIQNEIKNIEFRLNLFKNLNTKISELKDSTCQICLDDFNKFAIFNCGHIFCDICIKRLLNNKLSINCPLCRSIINKNDINIIDNILNNDSVNENENENENGDSENGNNKRYNDNVNKWGTKMAYLIEYLIETLSENKNNRIIIFSQWKKMLNLVGNVLNKMNISHVYVKGNIHIVTNSIRKFKNDPSIRVIMLSSETSCSGNNLTEASHVVLLDTMNASREQALAIEEQAIGRTKRLGQTKRVKVTRLIMENTIEYDYYKRNMRI
jgi:SNF2 family DNA or RNA helicase